MKSTRENVVKVPMSAAELREARKKARAEGLSLAAYLRRLAAEAPATESERTKRLAALTEELLRQGPRTSGRSDLDGERARSRWGERRDRDDS